MKTTLTTLLLVTLISSCSKHKVVTTKNYDTEKPCICNYAYIKYGSTTWFQDSCNKYQIGDTIQ